MENKISSLTCQNCGICCRNFPFVEVNNREMTALEKFTKMHRNEFTDPMGPTYDDGHFLKTKANGDCLFLKVDKGFFFPVILRGKMIELNKIRQPFYLTGKPHLRDLVF